MVILAAASTADVLCRARFVGLKPRAKRDMGNHSNYYCWSR